MCLTTQVFRQQLKHNPIYTVSCFIYIDNFIKITITEHMMAFSKQLSNFSTDLFSQSQNTYNGSIPNKCILGLQCSVKRLFSNRPQISPVQSGARLRSLVIVVFQNPFGLRKIINLSLSFYFVEHTFLFYCTEDFTFQQVLWLACCRACLYDLGLSRCLTDSAFPVSFILFQNQSDKGRFLEWRPHCLIVLQRFIPDIQVELSLSF